MIPAPAPAPDSAPHPAFVQRVALSALALEIEELLLRPDRDSPPSSDFAPTDAFPTPPQPIHPS